MKSMNIKMPVMAYTVSIVGPYRSANTPKANAKPSPTITMATPAIVNLSLTNSQSMTAT